jgi:hypothetical protein
MRDRLIALLWDVLRRVDTLSPRYSLGSCKGEFKRRLQPQAPAMHKTTNKAINCVRSGERKWVQGHQGAAFQPHVRLKARDLQMPSCVPPDASDTNNARIRVCHAQMGGQRAP